MREALEVKTIDVKITKDKPLTLFSRVFSMLGAIALTIIGVVLFMTIIGILFAIPVFMTAFVLFAAAIGLGYQKVNCPSCNKMHAVKRNQEDFKCKRCGQPTIIKWLK